MTRLRNRIFGDVVRKTDSSSMRTVKLFQEKPIYAKPEVMNYYPRHVDIYNFMLKLRAYGLYRDEHQDFSDEMLRLKIARGKIKPEKKHGKKQEENK
ncbi:hypothetical protein RUM44_011032 [Polyplax serrata]|uniref:Small ribosomal subunit protein mS33 n=1 Tax=Polyplax serrata TaxID=468196 RepID=A0ABR1ANX5_POLSC